MSKAEKFISEHTRNCSNAYWNKNDGDSYFPWLTPAQARKAVDIAREEMLEKVYSFIADNIGDYIDLRCANPTTFCVINGDKFVTDLKQVMK